MRCPKCSSPDDRVVDSRSSRDGTSIRRRRECVRCGQRFSTTEEVLREGLVVLKSDGTREDFDRNKILAGLRRACEKRPVASEQLNMLLSDVTAALEKEFDDEIPSRAIGEQIMKHLRHIDKVAYVRFASVYKDFRDVNEFTREITSLGAPE